MNDSIDALIAVLLVTGIFSWAYVAQAIKHNKEIYELDQRFGTVIKINQQLEAQINDLKKMLVDSHDHFSEVYDLVQSYVRQL